MSKLKTEFSTTITVPDPDGTLCEHSVTFRPPSPNDKPGWVAFAIIGREPFTVTCGRWDTGNPRSGHDDRNQGWHVTTLNEAGRRDGVGRLPGAAAKALDEALAQAPKPSIEDRLAAIERHLNL